jgi:HD-GYP domain-containing protein (c-di-GMP phosphodiesterase class II)
MQSLKPADIKVGEPLPWPVFNRAGQVVLKRGDVIQDEKQLNQLVWKGLYIEVEAANAAKRSVLNQVDDLWRKEAYLDTIARVQPSLDERQQKVDAQTDPWTFWSDIQHRLAMLLRAPQFDAKSLQEVLKLHTRIEQEFARRDDAALLLLVMLNLESAREYSSKHALLCAAIIRRLGPPLGLDEKTIRLSSTGALVMNLAMTALQDELALQSSRVRPEQREIIASHGQVAAEMLAACGAERELVELVRTHSDPAKAEPELGQAALHLHTADVFAAKVSPRATRKPMLSQQIAREAYLDPDPLVKRYGIALVKSMGIYLPGCLVRLENEEIGVVLRQDPGRADQPLVAAIIGREGFAILDPVPRKTGTPSFRVKEALGREQVNVRIPVEKLLVLL